MPETNIPYYAPYIFLPSLRLEEDCYASLRLRLDMYDDMILATKYSDGRAGPVFAVDPMDMAAALGSLNFSSGFLPPGCLFWSRKKGLERLAIYVAPDVWPVSVHQQKQTWHIPLPGFIFVGHGNAYNLYAVKRPPTSPEAVLYNFPAANIGENGVCAGNAPFPGASTAKIWNAVKVFFESVFTPHLANQKSLSHPQNILDKWALLNESGASTYPVGDLVEAERTLKEVIE